MKGLLLGNSTLTALLGKFTNGTTPLIEGGELAEVETDLPAIVFLVEPSNKQKQTLGDYNFLLNVYGATARESFIVANTIIEEFNGCQNPINGYFTQTTCSILTQVVDPSSKEVNTPVTFRIINI
jgi:hypothetical protein